MFVTLGMVQCKKQVAPAQTSPPPVSAGPSDRELADRSFLRGDYRDAAEFYGSYLARNPDAGDRDIALLRLAISYAFLDNPSQDLARTEALLEEIVQGAESVYVAEAELMLKLVDEIRRLREESSLKSRELTQVKEALQGFEEREKRRWELEVADRNYSAGDYESAALGYSRYLERYPDGEERDRALFHLAVSHALPDSPVYDPDRTEELLGGIVADRNSKYKPEAQHLLTLIRQIRTLRAATAEQTREIERLSSELEKLKEIDLKVQPSGQPD